MELFDFHSAASIRMASQALVPPVPSPTDFPNKYQRSRLLLPYFTLQPMKMEPIEGSETSAIINQTPENYPKGNLLYHGMCSHGTIKNRWENNTKMYLVQDIVQ